MLTRKQIRKMLSFEASFNSFPAPEPGPALQHGNAPSLAILARESRKKNQKKTVKAGRRYGQRLDR